MLRVCCLFAAVFGLSTAANLTILTLQDYFEGDILLPKHKYRNGIPQNMKWEQNTIIYAVEERSWNTNQIAMINEAIRLIETHTCLRFKKRTNEVSYTAIIRDRGCYGQVGQETPRVKQYMSLDDNCWTQDIVTHEMLHVAGLWHEHSRKDRDNHMYIFKQNAAKDKQFNFDIFTQSETYGVPYNYMSIMQYESRAFSDNTRYTMFPKDPYYLHVIGNVQGPADSDFEKLRRAYQCKGSYPAAPAQKLPQAYKPCEDKIDYCYEQADKCMTAKFMPYNCQKFCNFCGSTGGGSSAVCTDTRRDCIANLDKCSDDPAIMMGCKKSCFLCNSGAW